MKHMKRISAVVFSICLIWTCSLAAFAEVDREAIINAWFKYRYETQGIDGIYKWAYKYEAEHKNITYQWDSTHKPPVSDNAFAAVEYEWVKKSVALIDDDDLKKVYTDTESSLMWLNDTFSGAYNYYGIDRGMTLLWDYGVEGYEDGVWLTAESGDELLNAEKYRRVVFIDNGDSFTLQTEDGTENLGTYKKVVGFDTDDDIGYSGDLDDYFSGGGSTGGTGGSAGGAASQENTVSNDENTDPISETSRTTSSTSRVSSESSGDSTKTNSVVSGNNAPVTPEIVSAVDAAKSAKESENITSSEATEAATDYAEPVKRKSNLWIIIIAVAAAAIGAYFFVKSRNKKEN